MIATARKALGLFDARQRWHLAGLFVLMLVGSAFEVLGVSMMVPIVAAMMDSSVASSNAFFAWFFNLMPTDSQGSALLSAIALLIGVFAVKTAFLTFQYRMQFRFVYRNRARVQGLLLQSFLGKPYEYFLEARTGELLRIIRNDVTKTFELVTVLLVIATELTVSVVLVATIFLISHLMTIFIACTMGITSLVIIKLLRPAMRRQGKRSNEVGSQLNQWILQSITGVKDVKVARREAFFEGISNRYAWESAEIDQVQSVMKNTPRLLIEMTCVCSVLAVIAIMHLQGASPDTLIPELSAFAMAAVKLMPSASRIVSSTNQATFCLASLEKVLENLPAKGELDPPAAPAPAAGATPPAPLCRGIELHDITYHYPNSSENVLEHAELSIERGSCVGIVGASGAGKTTAVDILLGLLNPQDGVVLADGVDIQQDYPGWLSRIGYIPQEIFMLDGTIRANVAFGHAEDDVDDARVWNALEEAQLAGFVRSLPDGLLTRVGERGVRLSGGQRQRIGIARALYDNPEVLVFDEATSALDTPTEREIMKAVYQLQGDKTMVIIAHRLTTIEQCDHIFRVEEKHIVQQR